MGKNEKKFGNKFYKTPILWTHAWYSWQDQFSGCHFLIAFYNNLSGLWIQWEQYIKFFNQNWNAFCVMENASKIAYAKIQEIP